MMERIEQRYCIKFCQKLGDTQVETIQKIQQAFLESTVYCEDVLLWKMFQSPVPALRITYQSTSMEIYKCTE